MYLRAYLRASTKDQDANRAKTDLVEFAKERGLRIASFYIEHESGASLQRPELFRLLSDCHEGDVLLVEQVDRLSRLNAEDWNRLKHELQSRRVRVVALDLPTSWIMTNQSDDITGRMMDALNSMMLDMLAAIARKDYDDRRRRQAQGIAKLKEAGGYRGRKPDDQRNAAITNLLRRGDSWNSIIAATGCSRSTLSRLSQQIKQEEAGSSFSAIGPDGVPCALIDFSERRKPSAT
ncbi:DNA invertase Pin-like site-specific DNA recombinase [Paraburkholderia sp. BL6669N2]|uniref:recombinase family protein n=1 Tax=Paraburkholderia sp. BL6669N2 TaxID=1938807 RepID=UPI000E22C752|nr:recombinase family protein [Paraburkholderia sp. BL6669N2]REG60072.1 DNA invertase Pin-like site-specific DNA recombinase [Paraburkholderia sp. BL6669N2]